MARYNHYARQQYIYGNAVPKEDPRQERYERDERARERAAASQRDKKEAMRMDMPYVCLLAIASVITLIICVSYLHIQARITASIKHIENQEARLEELKNNNDALESHIDASVDLNEVYRIATEELGMVYADKNQVVTYDRTPTEYVRQNDDITE